MSVPKEEIPFLEKLACVRSELVAVSKSKSNTYLKTKYADLNLHLDVVEPILEKYRLLLLQKMDVINSRNVIVTTITDLDNVGNISSSMVLPENDNPQHLGSAITYFRRYTLASLLVMRAVDDDGEQGKPKKPLGMKSSILSQILEESSSVKLDKFATRIREMGRLGTLNSTQEAELLQSIDDQMEYLKNKG